MKLITKSIRAALLKNGQATEDAQMIDRDEPDHRPVVKFFDPCGAATWLITESDPNEPDRLFGLCDLGLGFPELGYVSLDELQSIELRFGLGIERDIHWKAASPLSEYADAARVAGHIS